MLIGNIGATAKTLTHTVMSSPKTPPQLAFAPASNISVPDFMKIPGITAPFAAPAYTQPGFVPTPLLPKSQVSENVPVNEVIDEIVVTAKRIPWWQWMLGGVAAILVTQQIFKR